MRRTACALCLAVVPGLLAYGGQAFAQEASPGNVPPRIEQGSASQNAARRKILFAKMMVEPANLEIAFEYASLSAQAGDLESAISTLERMLIFAPDEPRLQLELGVLYYRLGSYEVARNYLNAALKAPNIPISVKMRVDSYLAEIRDRTAIDRFNGAVVFGTRFQSNATGGTRNDTLNLGWFDFPLPDDAKADSDFNAFVLGNFLYSHDLASQGDRFDVQLLTYGTLYGEHHEINIALAELTFGPVFSLDRFDLDHTDFGIYGILGGVTLSGDPYQLSGGAGVMLDKALTRDTRARLQVEYRHQDYRDSELRPNASDRTGNDIRVVGSLSHQLTDRFAVFASVEGERQHARQDYASNRQIGAIIGGTYLLDPPIGEGSQPWTVGLNFGAIDWRFDGPDPAMFMTTDARHDVEAFVQGSLTIPLRSNWSVQTVLGYRNVSSNDEINAFNDVSLSLGLMKSF